MSEETTNYGIPNTTLDTDAFPPQTGDLLGSYIARLSARVRDLESKFEDMDANENTMFERLNEVQKQVDHWFNNDVENRIVALEARIERLEQAAQPEAPTVTTPDEKRVRKSLLCDQCQSPLAHGVIGSVHWCSSGFINDGEFGCRGFVPEAPAVTTQPKPASQPEPTAEPVCATCGHDEADHLITFGDKAQFLLCDGGTLGKPCRCTGYRP